MNKDNRQEDELEKRREFRPFSFEVMFLWICLGAVYGVMLVEPGPVPAVATVVGAAAIWLVS